MQTCVLLLHPGHVRSRAVPICISGFSPQTLLVSESSTSSTSHPVGPAPFRLNWRAWVLGLLAILPLAFIAIQVATWTRNIPNWDEFDTVLGRIGFNEKGDIEGFEPFVWFVWRGGKDEPLEEVQNR